MFKPRNGEWRRVVQNKKNIKEIVWGFWPMESSQGHIFWLIL